MVEQGHSHVPGIAININVLGMGVKRGCTTGHQVIGQVGFEDTRGLETLQGWSHEMIKNAKKKKKKRK